MSVLTGIGLIVVGLAAALGSIVTGEWRWGLITLACFVLAKGSLS